MNRYAFGAALAALSLAIPAAALAQRTPNAVVVVVDTERVFRDCVACKAASAQLQTQVTALEQRTQALGLPLSTEGQSIQQAAQAARALPAGAGRTTAENALQTRATAFEARRTAAGQELQGREQAIRSTQANVVRQINERLNPIYNEVMTRRNANIALDTNATLARSNAIDVTNEVLAALDRALPSVNVVPLPAPAGTPAPVTPQPPGR